MTAKEYIEREAAVDKLIPICKNASFRNRNVLSTARKCLEAIEAIPAADVVEARRLTGYDEGLIKDLEWYCRDHRHPKWTRELVKRAAESITGKNEYRGGWVTYKGCEHTECICSACKKSYYYHNKGQYQINKSRYCPNCGAKMYGKEGGAK